MNVNLHIERIVVDDMGAEAIDTRTLRDVAINELITIFSRSRAIAPATDASRSHLHASTASDSHRPCSAMLGLNIANSVASHLRHFEGISPRGST